MSDRVGQQLGNYKLVRLLGQGGFAEVYLAEHVHLDTQVAIKVLHTQLVKDDIEPFRNEARTIARLVHPHIIRVLDFGVEGQSPFLVMDYAPHGTLRQRYARGVQLPLATIVTYAKQIADALQHAHDEKLIHRDIKPENILVGRREEILLSDFGIALVAQSSQYQKSEDVMGTVAYMAPEQIQGKPRPASDQYSLGIVIYEWLCGRRPFQGTFIEIVTQHAAATPPSLHEQVPGISQEVERVVLTALEKDPRKRFANMRAFANALEQASLSAQAQTSSSNTLQQPSALSISAQPPTVVATNIAPINTPELPAILPAAQATNVLSSNTPVLPPIPSAVANPTNIISTATPTPSLAGAPTDAISTHTPTPTSVPPFPGLAPDAPTYNQPAVLPENRLSRRTLVDYLIPTPSLRVRLLRDGLLIIGFVVLFLLCSVFALDILPIIPFPITFRTLVVLLMGAVLGSRRGALAMLTAVLIALALGAFSNSHGNTVSYTLPFLSRQPLLDFPTSSNGSNILPLLPYLYLLKYVGAAFATGLLCERLLNRNIRTLLSAMLPGSLILLVITTISLAATYQLNLQTLSYRIVPSYLLLHFLSSLAAAGLLLALWRVLRLARSNP